MDNMNGSINDEKNDDVSNLMNNKNKIITIEIPQLQCEICDAKFKRKQSFNNHIASVHEEKRPHQCKICTTKFGYRYELKRHISSIQFINSYLESY